MKVLVNLVMQERKAVLISILLGSIGGITAAGLFAMSGYIISEASLKPPLYVILILAACLKLFGFTKSVSRYFERVVSHEGTLRILSNIRMTFYDQLERLAPRIFTKYRSGDLLSRIVSDVESLQNFFLRVFYPPIVLAIVFICTIFFTMFYSVWIALVILVSLILTAVVIPTLRTKRHEKVGQHKLEKRAALSTEMTEVLYGYRDLTISHTLHEQMDEVAAIADAYAEEQHKESKALIRDQALNAFVSMLTVASVLVIGAYFVTTGSLNGLYLAMLVLITLTVFDLAIPMALVPTFEKESDQAMTRLQMIEQEDFGKETDVGTFIKKQPFSIAFQDVSFRYEGQAEDTLQHIQFMALQGSRTAIVGASGSGKSTIFQLMLDLYNPTSGQIRIAGQPLEEIQSEDLWKKTTVLLQQNHFFYGTIRDNLRIAKPIATDEELDYVLKEMELDFDLNMQVLEHGENLSGGEKQRLALGRMWLKNTSVWLLDEPFSALDPATTKRLHHKLIQKTKGKTVVMISHRLQGLEQMDQILVVDEGRIAEVGTHADLIEQQGIYYHLKQIDEHVLQE